MVFNVWSTKGWKIDSQSGTQTVFTRDKLIPEQAAYVIYVSDEESELLKIFHIFIIQ